MRADIVAIGLGGQTITTADIEHSERMHFARGHNCAWEDCQDGRCFDDMVKLGIAYEEDRPCRDSPN